MRVMLFTGKGGVGKTTLAAATGFATAQLGLRTLLLSTDIAHSLGDVLGSPLTNQPTVIPGGPNELLSAAEVDVRGEFEAAWSTIRSNLVGLLSAGGMSELAAEEMTVLPGVDEVICLLQVERWCASGEFDVIIVDCAPTGETLKLLALPETLSFYSDRLMSVPMRIMKSVAAGLSGRATGPHHRVRDAVSDLLDRLIQLRQRLTDPEQSGITLVVTPEAVVVAEAGRALTALALHGYPVAGVLVNRLLPTEVPGSWAHSVRQGQQEQLAVIDSSFAGLDIRQIPTLGVEPRGADLLNSMAQRLYGDDHPIPKPTAYGYQFAGSAGRYSLTMPLPMVDRGQLTLTRVSDELVITIGSQRRRIALPSVLRRCRTTGARFDGSDLVISFEPDPARWPTALVAT